MFLSKKACKWKIQTILQFHVPLTITVKDNWGGISSREVLPLYMKSRSNNRRISSQLFERVTALRIVAEYRRRQLCQSIFSQILAVDIAFVEVFGLCLVSFLFRKAQRVNGACISFLNNIDSKSTLKNAIQLFHISKNSKSWNKLESFWRITSKFDKPNKTFGIIKQIMRSS